MEYGPFTRAHGAIGTDGRFAIFPDAATGWLAMWDRLQTDPYPGMTLNDAIAAWAPSNENDTAVYQAHVAAWTGLDMTRLVGSLSDLELAEFAAAIMRQEGWF